MIDPVAIVRPDAAGAHVNVVRRVNLGQVGAQPFGGGYGAKAEDDVGGLPAWGVAQEGFVAADDERTVCTGTPWRARTGVRAKAHARQRIRQQRVAADARQLRHGPREITRWAAWPTDKQPSFMRSDQLGEHVELIVGWVLNAP